MRPILFRFRHMTIWSYPALLYFGLVAGVVAGNLAAHSLNVDPFRVWIATLILIVTALVGARLLFVFRNWKFYCADRSRIWCTRDGGQIFYGGFPFALLVSVPLAGALHLNLGAFWDVASFTILTGIIFGRVGCFLHGCCAGRLSESWFAIDSPNPQGVWRKRIPTQIMEALWSALLLVIAILACRSIPFHGALFLIVAFGSAFGRFLIEFARERESGEPGFLLNRAIALVTVVCAMLLLSRHWHI